MLSGFLNSIFTLDAPPFTVFFLQMGQVGLDCFWKWLRSPPSNFKSDLLVCVLFSDVLGANCSCKTLPVENCDLFGRTKVPSRRG